ncbi:universal stress protein [Antarcticibacterium sp. 1MA-6-2]|uniref:universal stress protein n=1 Tax=Antarcticibacterium sp. 1MA-6-2 TaxID=2908210 RepID=UPI001F1B203D|nr:universal stress protein [Antarcticibacterium sp. 1MA-6-2]UJH90851.1 universal stress protein [Antarcticibacterium sp. 1MA-6-2]
MMNILLPTDFSENSKNAAIYALQFFKDVPCNFHLLHVMTAPSMAAGISNSNIPQDVQKKFDELLSLLHQLTKNAEHTFNISFKVNFLIEAVRQQVDEKKIDLILMGTKGATNKKGPIIGKNTSDVMMKVKCPVMAISENAIFKTHKEILFPTDYKIHYSERMLNTLLILTNLSKASVKILELFNSELEPSEEQITNKTFLHNSFVSDKPLVQTYYSAQNTDTNLFFQANPNVDMIVMAAKNLNLCQKLLKNTSQNQIPFINKLPLLVLHG